MFQEATFVDSDGAAFIFVIKDENRRLRGVKAELAEAQRPSSTSCESRTKLENWRWED